MNQFGMFWKRLRSLVQQREVKREIDEELRFHLEQRTADNLVAGMSPEAMPFDCRRMAYGGFRTLVEA